MFNTTAVKGKTEPRIYTGPLPQNLDKHGEIIHCGPRQGCSVGDGDNCICRTDGYCVIKFAEDCLHMSLFPWQKWLLIHALELVKDENGNDTYRFRIVIVELARQNGKTVVATILALWHLFVRQSRTVIGTAQDLSKADDTWFDAVSMAEADDELSQYIDPEGIFKGHPKRWTLTTGCQYRVASATRRGGRGFSGDLILMDELREHKNWESWSAVTNTMNARPQGQMWCFSNAGDATSVVLRYQRAVAHRDLGWPDGDREFEGVLDEIDDELAEMLAEVKDLSPGWFEYSAPPGTKRNDLEALAQANPSMNHTEVTLECPTTRTLLSGVMGSPAYEAETEILCRWANMGVGGPFPEGSWEATLQPKARPADDTIRVVCVEVSARRSQTYIARAGLTDDDTFVVGIRYDHPGTDWVVETLLNDLHSIDAIVLRTDVGGSTLSLVEEIQREVIGPKFFEWKGGDINVAHGLMFDLLRDRKIEHLPHTGLDMAATSAVEVLKPGGGFTVDIRRSPTDVAPLYAAIGAVWGLEQMTASDYDILKSVG